MSRNEHVFTSTIGSVWGAGVHQPSIDAVSWALIDGGVLVVVAVAVALKYKSWEWG